MSREYSMKWGKGDELHYPINDAKNNGLYNKNNGTYNKYKEFSLRNNSVIFGGRLGQYTYFDMHTVIKNALDTVQVLLNNENLDEV